MLFRSPQEKLLEKAQEVARSLAEGPAFAHAMTKKCLHQEWNQSIEQAIETEAEAQAICMQTRDFERAYNAFVAKQKPIVFLTSNNAREMSDALKRRCLHLFIDYPSEEVERKILETKVPGAAEGSGVKKI